MSTWRRFTHLKNRKPNPFLLFVSTAFCTVLVILLSDIGVHLDILPIYGLIEPISIRDDPQTLASHNNVCSPDFVTWNEQISG